MAPSATSEQPAAAQPQEKTYPPAKIYNVKETRFEKFIAPDSEGRKKALQQNGNAAIVIDNGTSRSAQSPAWAGKQCCIHSDTSPL